MSQRWNLGPELFRFTLFRFTLFAFLGLFACLEFGSWSTVRAEPPQAAGPSDDFEESPEPLSPRVPRTEADADRILAAAHFTSGRLLLNQMDTARALERFQRAWRYDPESVAALNQVVQLAQQLQRYEIAARYAILAAERNPTSPELLTRLSVILAQQNDLARAARFVEQAIRLRTAAGQEAELPALYLELGRLRFLRDEYGLAAEAFHRFLKSIEVDKANSEELRKRLLRDGELVYEMMGVSFVEAGRLDEGEACFRQADEFKPRPGILAYRLAEVAFARQQSAQARESLAQALAGELGEVGQRPYELLARWHAREEPNSELARRNLVAELQDKQKQLQTTKASKSGGALSLFLGRQLLALREWALAEQQLLDGEITPERLRGLLELYRQTHNPSKLLVTLGTAQSRFGSIDVLVPELEKLRENDESCQQLVASVSESLQAGTAASDLPPGAALAVAYLALGRREFSLADELFGMALESEPAERGSRLLNWALAMLKAEQYALAAMAWRTTLQEKLAGGDTMLVEYHLAGALAMDGNAEEALQFAQQAAAHSKAPAIVKLRPAWVLYHARRYADSEERHRQFLQEFGARFDSEDTRSAVRQAHLVLSNLCVVQDRLPEAEEWLERVLDEFPEDVGAMNDLGYLWVDQNKHLGRALRMIERAVAAEPDNRAFRDSLGWAYYRLGRVDDAIRELEVAAAEEKPDAVVLEHLGDALWAQGKSDRAVVAWSRAAEAAAKDQNSEKVRKLKLKIQKHSATSPQPATP